MATNKRHPFLGLTVAALAALSLGGCNIGCWFAPCHASNSIAVTARGPSGDPLSGVLIEVDDKSGKTDSNGCVVVEGVASRRDDIYLRATKEGYKVYEATKPWNDYQVEIALEPQPSSGASTATWQIPSESDVLVECR